MQDHLIAEVSVFSFPLKEGDGGGEEVRTAPYVYVSSLWVKLKLCWISMRGRNLPPSCIRWVIDI